MNSLRLNWGAATWAKWASETTVLPTLEVQVKQMDLKVGIIVLYFIFLGQKRWHFGLGTPSSGVLMLIDERVIGYWL